ncbi:hypothetical protein HET73_01910 [Wolbachia endosymbiont of Atemnus politus]|nr:hypothetical protein [Wolbachia endosymbiont of Atemnus politus]NSM56364.1 hypothetical protein [Wolbachia endosymbiont of Atemnus politus]
MFNIGTRFQRHAQNCTNIAISGSQCPDTGIQEKRKSSVTCWSLESP